MKSKSKISPKNSGKTGAQSRKKKREPDAKAGEALKILSVFCGPALRCLSAKTVTSRDVLRFWMDTAIAAERSGNRQVIEKLTSVEMVKVMAGAANEPDSFLARELSAPARAITNAIGCVAVAVEAAAKAAGDAKREDWRDATARVLDQLDFALALILRNLGPLVRMRARLSKHTELLCDTITNGLHAGETVRLIERLHSLQPGAEAFKNDRENSFATFAWDVANLVDDLDRLVESRADYLKPAGRDMNAWPILRFRHNDGKGRFEAVADAVELGADHPLDTSKDASFRPETPMVRYLNEVVWLFHCVRDYVAAIKSWCPDETQAVQQYFSGSEEETLQPKVIEAVRSCISLPELRKSNAPDWARVAVLPYVIARDARGPATCMEPALKAIWNQNGVKSPATFKSRLMPQVIRTLTSLARPG